MYDLSDDVFGHFGFWCENGRLSALKSSPGNLPRSICLLLFLFLQMWSNHKWVPQHLLVLHPGRKYFNLLILSGGNFFFLCRPVETPHSKQWLATWSQLISWLVSQSVSFGHSTKLMNQSMVIFGFGHSAKLVSQSTVSFGFGHSAKLMSQSMVSFGHNAKLMSQSVVSFGHSAKPMSQSIVGFGHSAKLTANEWSALATIPNWWANQWSALATMPNWWVNGQSTLATLLRLSFNTTC